MSSINRNASEIVEKTASTIIFDQTNTWGQIGAPTTEQQQDGINTPNVQSALDDLHATSRVPIGGVIQTLGSNPPSKEPTVLNSQNSTITVSGTATANGSVVIDGITVAFTSGQTASAIAASINSALSAATSIFDSVSLAGSAVTYDYVDSNTHPIVNQVINGVTFSSVVNTLGGDVGYIGYGSWQLLGSETKYSKTIYSWLRVA